MLSILLDVRSVPYFSEKRDASVFRIKLCWCVSVEGTFNRNKHVDKSNLLEICGQVRRRVSYADISASTPHTGYSAITPVSFWERVWKIGLLTAFNHSYFIIAVPFITVVISSAWKHPTKEEAGSTINTALYSSSVLFYLIIYLLLLLVKHGG